MKSLKKLFDNNRAWAERIKSQDPNFFKRLSRGQKPKYFWVGCCDSRVPANQIIDLVPGEVFVHRNIANLIHSSDLNCMSSLQFAVESLQVEHVIICGHYGCGGVRAANTEENLGLIDFWIWEIKRALLKNEYWMRDVNPKRLAHCQCELNVIEQVYNLAQSQIIRDAWRNGQKLHLHGWIYDVADGLLQDLGTCIRPQDESTRVHEGALEALRTRYLQPAKR